jgi:hypothetical protein
LGCCTNVGHWTSVIRQSAISASVHFLELRQDRDLKAGNKARVPGGYNLCVSTDFLDRLASQLRANKSAACRRAIQRVLAIVKNNFSDGKYRNDVEAEADFRRLVDREEGCK